MGDLFCCEFQWKQVIFHTQGLDRWLINFLTDPPMHQLHQSLAQADVMCDAASLTYFSHGLNLCHTLHAVIVYGNQHEGDMNSLEYTVSFVDAGHV